MISSQGREWKDRRVCKGSVEETEGVCTFLYSLEGDECRLVATEWEMFQMREGQTNLDLHFVPFQKTACRLKSGDQVSEYTILTKKYEFRKTETGHEINLVYLSGEDKERIRLSFRSIDQIQELS